jgi:leucyl aminopeptidase
MYFQPKRPPLQLLLINLQQGVTFIDITAFTNTSHHSLSRLEFPYPMELTQGTAVMDLIAKFDRADMQKVLEGFTSFRSRLFASDTGGPSADWLFNQLTSYVGSNTPVIFSRVLYPLRFPVASEQLSITATIPGKSSKTVIVGAHLDSINWGKDGDLAPEEVLTARAPGAGRF